MVWIRGSGTSHEKLHKPRADHNLAVVGQVVRLLERNPPPVVGQAVSRQLDVRTCRVARLITSGRTCSVPTAPG